MFSRARIVYSRGFALWFIPEIVSLGSLARLKMSSGVGSSLIRVCFQGEAHEIASESFGQNPANSMINTRNVTPLSMCVIPEEVKRLVLAATGTLLVSQ